MRRFLSFLPLLALVVVGCRDPELEPTGGGYGPGVVVPADADTGLIAPHEGAAPLDSAAEDAH